MREHTTAIKLQFQFAFHMCCCSAATTVVFVYATFSAAAVLTASTRQDLCTQLGSHGSCRNQQSWARGHCIAVLVHTNKPGSFCLTPNPGVSGGVTARGHRHLRLACRTSCLESQVTGNLTSKACLDKAPLRDESAKQAQACQHHEAAASAATVTSPSAAVSSTQPERTAWQPEADSQCTLAWPAGKAQWVHVMQRVLAALLITCGSAHTCVCRWLCLPRRTAAFLCARLQLCSSPLLFVCGLRHTAGLCQPGCVALSHMQRGGVCHLP